MFILLSCSKLIGSLMLSFPQDYVYPDAKDRQFLHYFYKGASKKEFSVKKYNELKDELAQVGLFVHFFPQRYTGVQSQKCRNNI